MVDLIYSQDGGRRPDVIIADLDPIAAVPSGRTSIVNALGINRFGTSGTRMFAYYRVVGASDPANYTWTLSKAVKWGGGISASTGVDATTPLDSRPLGHQLTQYQ